MPLSSSKKAAALGLGLVFWILILAGGGMWLYARSFEAGVSGSPGEVWPAKSRLVQDRSRHTLVLALHPECPCSSATVTELASILDRARGRLAVRVLMAQYDDLDQPIEKSDLWRQVSALPDVTLLADRDCAEIRLFAARTSGEARLYDPAGRLLFKGGITLARGHVGDNPGEQHVVDLVSGARRADASSTPVFGCSL